MLSRLHEAVTRGEFSAETAGDYLALTKLQTDAFVTLDPELAGRRPECCSDGVHRGFAPSKVGLGT